MEKFIVTKQGYYSGHSPNGTIPMNNEFNLNNLPTNCHQWNGTNWVLDTVSNLSECKETLNNVLTAKYDEVIEDGYKYSQIVDEVETEYNFYCSSTTLAKLDVSVRNVERVVAKGETPTATQLSYYDRNKKLCTFADADEFIAFMIDYTDHIDAIDKKKVLLSNDISNAKNADELYAIDITF